jgi:hypothetical protein
MGEVYLAFDTSLRRQVAIKLLPAAFTENKAPAFAFRARGLCRFESQPSQHPDDPRDWSAAGQ